MCGEQEVDKRACGCRAGAAGEAAAAGRVWKAALRPTAGYLLRQGKPPAFLSRLHVNAHGRLALRVVEKVRPSLPLTCGFVWTVG